jgi:hypothetical protein
LEQITRTLPSRRTILQFSQIRFTLDRTFMTVAAFVSVRACRLASTAATPGGTADAMTADDAGGTRPARPGDISRSSLQAARRPDCTESTNFSA